MGMYTRKTLKLMGIKVSSSGNTALRYLSNLGSKLLEAEDSLQDSVNKCNEARQKYLSIAQICKESARATNDQNLKRIYLDVANRAEAANNRIMTTVGKYAGSDLYGADELKAIEDLLNKTS